MNSVLIIGAHPDSFSLETDTTHLLMITASSMGHDVYYVSPRDLFIDNGVPKAHAYKVLIKDHDAIAFDTKSWYEFVASKSVYDINNFKAVFVRTDPPIDLDYYYVTQILDLVNQSTVNIINSPKALRDFNEKLAIFHFPDLIVPTMVSASKDVLHDFIKLHDECVVKPLNMMAGRGIFKVSNSDINKDVILEVATNYWSNKIMVQAFIKNVAHGDSRVFVVNGRVIDYILKRTPRENTVRGNTAAGGVSVVEEIGSINKAIGEAVAPWLLSKGIMLAGLDVIDGHLTEINITSPTGTRQILRSTGINIAKILLDRALNT